MADERVYIGCACGSDDCGEAAAGHRWCAGCERHVRLLELTEDGECPRHGALALLARVEARAKELHAASAQGPWEDLDPDLQRMWIGAAGNELRKAPAGGC